MRPHSELETYVHRCDVEQRYQVMDMNEVLCLSSSRYLLAWMHDPEVLCVMEQYEK